MNEAGFITLHRQSLRSWLWDMPPTQTKVAITLLLMANWCRGKTFSGGALVRVERGQVMTSLDSLAREARVSRQATRTALANLKKCNFITCRATRRFSMITILNYDSFQSKPEDDQHTDEHMDGTPGNPPSDTPPTNGQPESNTDRTSKQSNKGSKGGQKKRGSQIPESWVPNEKHREMAAKTSTDVAEQVDNFRDHHKAKGSVMRDWDAAFRTWLRRTAKWAAEAAAKSGTTGQAPPMARDEYTKTGRQELK